jgi:hypothetical protein
VPFLQMLAREGLEGKELPALYNRDGDEKV